MPHSLVLAVGAGIGFFIAFIGLCKHPIPSPPSIPFGAERGSILASGGLFVIGGDTNNLVGLGGCKADDYIDASLPFYCGSRVMRSPTMWLGIFTGGCVCYFCPLRRMWRHATFVSFWAIR